jgi:hypothetical protein
MREASLEDIDSDTEISESDSVSMMGVPEWLNKRFGGGD